MVVGDVSWRDTFATLKHRNFRLLGRKWISTFMPKAVAKER